MPRTCSNCLNDKDLLVRNRHDICNLSDTNRSRTCKLLVPKQTFKYLVSLAKWLSFRLRTKLLWVRVLLQSLNFQIKQSLFYHSWVRCVKCVRIWSYSGPYFPVFELNTERYSVSLRIQSKCGKIRTRITPNTDTFYAVVLTEAT